MWQSGAFIPPCWRVAPPWIRLPLTKTLLDCMLLIPCKNLKSIFAPPYKNFWPSENCEGYTYSERQLVEYRLKPWAPYTYIGNWLQATNCLVNLLCCRPRVAGDRAMATCWSMIILQSRGGSSIGPKGPGPPGPLSGHTACKLYLIL